MAAMIIDGKKIAEQIKLELMADIQTLKKQQVTPGLATILVGDNPASATYVQMKEKMCAELEMRTRSYRLPATIAEDELVAIVQSLGQDPEVHGILVQLPLPAHIQARRIIYAIPPQKDVDGFHPLSWGRMMLGEDTFLPCTPAGIQELLWRSGFSPEKKHVVIVGRSQIVGLPLANILVRKAPGANATVTICHTGTPNMGELTRQADILVAAMGKPEVITADMVNDHAIVIDVGVNRILAPETKRGYRLVGDVHFDSVSQKARAISPVPGGVGPMTIMMLMKNTVKAAQWSISPPTRN